jgi:cell shape-determining protein MreC
MDTHKEEAYPELELLNKTCLDMVAQIEQLKKENARLKKMQESGNGSARKGVFTDDGD